MWVIAKRSRSSLKLKLSRSSDILVRDPSNWRAGNLVVIVKKVKYVASQRVVPCTVSSSLYFSL